MGLACLRPQNTPYACRFVPTTPHASVPLSLLSYLTYFIYPYKPIHSSHKINLPHFQLLPISLYLQSSTQKPTNLERNGHQKTKPAYTNSSSEADSEAVLQLGKKAATLWRTGAPFGRSKGTFCGLCWRKQNQVHSPHLFPDPTRVPEPASPGRRGVRVRSRHGSHDSLRRRSFSVANVHAQRLGGGVFFFGERMSQEQDEAALLASLFFFFQFFLFCKFKITMTLTQKKNPFGYYHLLLVSGFGNVNVILKLRNFSLLVVVLGL